MFDLLRNKLDNFPNYSDPINFLEIKSITPMMGKSSYNYKLHFLLFLLLTFVPAFTYTMLGLVGFAGGLKISNASAFLLVLILLFVYHFLVLGAKSSRRKFSDLLRILFYVDFIIYMIVVLVAFNFIIIGFFLVNDQVPMGLPVHSGQSLLFILLGFYLLLCAGLGMNFLSKSRRDFVR